MILIWIILILEVESIELCQWSQPKGMFCLFSLLHVLIMRNVPVAIILVFFLVFYSISCFLWKYVSKLYVGISNLLLLYCLHSIHCHWLGSARLMRTGIFFLMRTCVEEGKSKIPQVEITDLALHSQLEILLQYL